VPVVLTFKIKIISWKTREFEGQSIGCGDIIAKDKVLEFPKALNFPHLT
jgi:hypothetical protein